jgi:uncharacterized membrane protein
MICRRVEAGPVNELIAWHLPAPARSMQSWRRYLPTLVPRRTVEHPGFTTPHTTLTMATHEGNPWAFAATLRLSAAALLLVMLSLLVEGLISSALVISAAVLALLGLIEFIHAWRRRSH